MSSRGQGELPAAWIGVRKDWEHKCTRFAQVLVAMPSNVHRYLIGSTGSGKSTMIHTLIAQSLMQRNPNVVVIDGRGDLATSTLELVSRAGIDHSLVKCLDFTRTSGPGFDPLSGAGEPAQRALAVVDAIEACSANWGVQLAETIRFGTQLAAETGGKLTDLERVFYDPSFRRSCLAMNPSPAVLEFWRRYDHMPLEKQQTFAAPVLNKISVLFATKSLRRIFSHPHPIDFHKQLSNSGSVTIISLRTNENRGAAWAVGTMILAAICREVFLRVDAAESMRATTHLYIDEFQNLQFDDILSVLAEGRRFRMFATLANQNLSQLSPVTRSIILGNVGAKLVFNTSHADAVILNKDIAGVGNAFELAKLAVGEAVFWQRGHEPFVIETNAPLIEDVGGASANARNYLDQLDAMCPQVDAPEVVPLQSEGTLNQNGRPRHSTRKPKSSLEDWLQ